jgi:hypothetical protein
VWPVAGIVTAFTVAHSITLGLAALKLVSLTPAFIEPAIAATIVLAALDNVLPIFPVRRVVVAFFFGLIHGFGFASVLAELELPRADFAWALLQFNLGIEAGQLAIVLVATTVLFTLRRWPGYARVVIGGGSAVAIAIGALVVHRADRERLDPAVLSAVAYNGARTHKSEKGMTVMTPRTPPPCSEGVARRASTHPVLSDRKSAAGPRFFIAGVSS